MGRLMSSCRLTRRHCKRACLGDMDGPRQVTPEGFEKTFAVGYLSARMLVTELMSEMERAHTDWMACCSRRRSRQTNQ